MRKIRSTIFALPFDDEDPDHGGGERHRDRSGDAEDLQRLRDAGKFGDGVAQVREHQREQDPESDFDAEPLADQIGEAFAGDHAHPGAHLLDQNQREGDRDQRPQQRVAEVGAGLRVGGDSARVVVDIGGDDARADHREDRAQPHQAAAPAGHGGARDPRCADPRGSGFARFFWSDSARRLSHGAPGSRCHRR